MQPTQRLKVRSCPSSSCANLGNQKVGAKGTVIGGPVSASGYIWWQIDYDVAPDGWSVETYLQEAVQSSSANIQIGNTVGVTTNKLRVRATPGGSTLGFQYFGAEGKVIAGPAQANGYTWWNIDYDIAPDGWSAENWLILVNTSTSEIIGVESLNSNYLTATASDAIQIENLKAQLFELQRQLDGLMGR